MFDRLVGGTVLPDTDRVVAIGFWQRPSNPLLHHRRMAYRVMTDPDLRGRLVGGIRVGPGDDRDDIWMMRRF